MLPLVLLTNDDGYNAPGLIALADELKDLVDLYVVAPDNEYSGKGCSLTLNASIKTKNVNITEGVKGVAVTGTPVDCVKLAFNYILPRKPDLVISGINPGENVGYTCFYSGTLGAAGESYFNGIPAIAFSVEATRGDVDFVAAANVAGMLVKNLDRIAISENIILNINLPSVKLPKIRGVRLTTQGNYRFSDMYDVKVDGDYTYYTLSTGLRNGIKEDKAYGNTDYSALLQDCISVTPLRYDLNTQDISAYRCVGILEELFSEIKNTE